MQQNLFWASNQRGFSIGVECLQNHWRAKEKARNKDTTGVDALTGPGTHVGCGLSPVADSSACAALFTNKRTLRVIVWVLERKKGGVPCRTTASCALEGMVLSHRAEPFHLRNLYSSLKTQSRILWPFFQLLTSPSFHGHSNGKRGSSHCGACCTFPRLYGKLQMTISCRAVST